MVSFDKTYRRGFYAFIGILPLNTFLTVWLASSVGHLFVWSAWPTLLVSVMALAAVYKFFTDKELQAFVRRDWLSWLIVAYVALHLLYLPFVSEPLLALIGAAFNTRFLILFAALRLLLRGYATDASRMYRWVLYVGGTVCVLALIQTLLLPADFLTSFGYDAPDMTTSGIPPAYHTIGGSDLIRAQATLRGPNLLGAYLLLPLSAAGVLFLAAKKRNERLRYLMFGLLLTAGLVMTFSRSAWLGAAVSALIIAAMAGLYKRKSWLIGAAAIFTVLLVLGAASRDTPMFKKIVLHESSEAIHNNSTPEHLRATKEGLADVAVHPFGEGPGSAGPVSALQKNRSAQVAENYFIQVGQEVGIAGLALLAAIHWLVARELWRRRQQTAARIALAAFLGLIATNLMLHIWADETVALTFWAFAGLTLSSDILNKKRK